MQNASNIQQVHNLIILDESGSMQSIRNSIINSFNELVQTIRAAEQKSRTEAMLQQHFVSLYTFNGTGIREVHFQAMASKVDELNGDTYRPDASTPLFDTMGLALTRHEQAIAGKADVVTLVTILTDGEENSSKEYTAQAINAMVKLLQEAGWVFTYIGTDHDVSGFSAAISIHSSMGYRKSDIGLQEMTRKMNASRTRFYEKIKDANYQSARANKDFFEDDDDQSPKP